MARQMRYEKPKNIKKTLRYFWGYMKKHRAALLAVSLLVSVSAAANVYGTYLLKPIINETILPGNIPGLIKMLFYMGGVYLLGALCGFAYTRLMAHVAQRIVKEIRDGLFAKVQTLPLRFFDGTTHGDLMSRFTNDIDTISEALNSCFTVLVQSTIVIIGTLAVLIILNSLLSVVVFLSFAGMVLFMRYSTKKSRQYFSHQQQFMGSLNGYVEETVAGQKVVKIFNREQENLKEFSDRNKKLKDAATGALTYSGLLIPVSVSISYFNYALSACIGALFAISGMIDLGALASYLVYVRQTAMPVNQFSQQMNFIMAALSGAERIFEIIELEPEKDEGTVTLARVKSINGKLEECAEFTGKWAWRRVKEDGTVELIPLQGDVRFHDVVFSYVSGSPVLKNVDFYAKPGQKIAFVGSTGAGKTTIANLLSRFYDVDSGHITYDGIDVKDIKKNDLRHSLAVVLQDTHLFTGTIADNIRFGNPDADMEKVIAAARLSNADSFIKRLPGGYNTLLTEDGANLSQGQRQLLAIARAAIMNPPVLILDEATSSVDAHTEKLIEAGMDRLMEGRTVFVIAHRLSTVRNAKALIVLENGAILERGSHEELLAKKGRYYNLYTGQFELS